MTGRIHRVRRIHLADSETSRHASAVCGSTSQLTIRPSAARLDELPRGAMSDKVRIDCSKCADFARRHGLVSQ